MPTADDDFAPEDFAPPGHTWTRDDELARMKHRADLATFPTGWNKPTDQQKGC